MTHWRRIWTIVGIIAVTISSDINGQGTQSAHTEVVLASEIKWRPLNPARGDANPQAGTVWGDQTEDGPSGFLVTFVDGFSSPPHIHNITYRGIVLGGALHNDDPKAAPMWMKTGSYWIQPAGEPHITAARGASVAYVEIQSGPYLVKPTSEAFDNGERPMNVDATNIVWHDASSTMWLKGSVDPIASKNVQIAFMWGRPERNQVYGTMVKLPRGFSGRLDTESSTFKVVVVDGEATLHPDQGAETKHLTPGGYFESHHRASHRLTCKHASTIYVRTKGKYAVIHE